MDEVKLLKSYLRNKYKALRRSMSCIEKKIMDEKITNRVFNTIEYNYTNTLATYISKDIEVSTIEIIKDAWIRNKFVGVPKCNSQDMTIKFYHISCFGDLEKCIFGIDEPIVPKCSEVKDFSNSICIIPGLCFDSFGYRLGYGYGYYDRFLPGFSGIKIGICYSDCMEFKLPRDIHDRPVDILVTDRYTKNILKK